MMIESDRELSAMVQELWDNDVNRLVPGKDYRISLQVCKMTAGAKVAEPLLGFISAGQSWRQRGRQRRQQRRSGLSSLHVCRREYLQEGDVSGWVHKEGWLTLAFPLGLFHPLLICLWRAAAVAWAQFRQSSPTCRSCPPSHHRAVENLRNKVNVCEQFRASWWHQLSKKNQMTLFFLPPSTAFISLLDNYESDTGEPEIVTPEEVAENHKFLDSIIKTQTMKVVWKNHPEIWDLWHKFHKNIE